MENKINIAELLKDCPSGMELDCTMYEDVYFDYVDELNIIHCYIQHETHKTSLTFNQYGTPNSDIKSKCVIFPKGKTTWEGFQRPFKDGDIVAYDNPHRDNLQVFIFKDKKENNTLSSCYLMLDGDELDLEEGMYYITRLATEEEKQKLFDAIKANGYKWNGENKTLKKLVEPKFKVGDKIKDKNNKIWFVVQVSDKHFSISLIPNAEGYFVPIEDQDEYELVPNKFDIATLKPFDKVLVRDFDNTPWEIDFFSRLLDGKHFKCVDLSYVQCIPYEENKHLLGTTNDCDEYYKTWE